MDALLAEDPVEAVVQALAQRLFAFGRLLWWASGRRFATLAGMLLLATSFAWFIQSRIAMLDSEIWLQFGDHTRIIRYGRPLTAEDKDFGTWYGVSSARSTSCSTRRRARRSSEWRT